jgi:hypothetical protein
MREIPLTQGKVAFVDDDDYSDISLYRWYALFNGRRYYAVRQVPGENGGQSILYMHRYLLGIAPGPDLTPDHASGDTLDNSRDNLRWATPSQQAANRGKQANNSSGYKGVCWDKRNNAWRAKIGFQGKQYFLGLFDSATKAHEAYVQAASKLQGRFARAS